MSYIQSNISFTNGQSVTEHYKSFINYFNHQAQKFSTNIFFRYYFVIDGKPGYKTLSYADVDRIATNLACELSGITNSMDTVSLFADHSVQYSITIIALLKLRVPILCISPRNSEPAIINLLEKTGSKTLMTSKKYQTVAEKSGAQVSGVKTVIFPKLDIEKLSKAPLNPNFSAIIDTNFSDEDFSKIAVIIHSSGSTNLPKPIYLSNRYLINLISPIHYLVNERKGLKPVDENSVSLSCLPFFHIFGFFSSFTMASVGGSNVFMEKLPPSQEEINFALKYNKCTMLWVPPLILEQIISQLEATNDFSAISNLHYVVFGGAPLKRESGEWLLNHGVNIRSLYGSTELGAIMSSDFDPKSKNWSSFAPVFCDPNGKPYCVFEVNDKSTPDIKHLYVRGDYPVLATGICNRSDGGFDTNDLFIEDPQFPGYYICIGRRDDTLIMENGEKTNPIPMESTIRRSPVVKQVVVIGNGRQCTAALISLDTDCANTMSPDEMLAAVHDAVKEANKDCPSHSVILPQMVKVLPLNKLLPSTDKGTVIRKRAEQQYQDIVEKLYKDFLEGPTKSQTKNADASTWSLEQLKEFLAESTSKVLDMPISTFKNHSQSLFDFGLNSLTSIQLRNMISEYFDNVPQNFIFQHPSINAMSEALTSAQTEDVLEQMNRRYQQTQDLAKEYIKKARKDFGVAENSYNQNKPTVVFLTGATGSLGSFILCDLLNNPSVKKVYCAVRGKPEQLYARLISAFESRSLDVSLLKNRDRVETVPMEFNKPYLGFSEERYKRLKEEVTIIQHCAWMLDFNMPIDHFNKECIAPFYNLLKFAYKDVDPIHVHFISSISASAAAGKEIEEVPLPFDSHVAMPMGYAQSKFVVEMLFNYLTTEKKFPCYIERLGQVCGDSRNGIWNASEQYPLMFVGGGSIMHKMPELNITIDWIPVDYAAASIADIMIRTAYLPANKDQYIFHIVNPHHIHWSDVLDAMRDSGMKFESVSPSEWVETLAKDDSNPAFRLMSFYEDNFKQTFNIPIWKTEKTMKVTPLIEKSPVLDAKLFSKFLDHWGVAVAHHERQKVETQSMLAQANNTQLKIRDLEKKGKINYRRKSFVKRVLCIL